MRRQLAEDAYVKCDIVTGRLYRCLTSLLQDFMDIQFSAVWGDRWIEQIAALAELVRKDKNSKNGQVFSALLKKKDNIGIEMLDKTALDVTLANTILLFNCYYVAAVPRYDLGRDEMIEILEEADPGDITIEFADDDELREKLLRGIQNDVGMVWKCQLHMNTYKTGKNGQQEIRDVNGKIKSLSFYKLVAKLVSDKNQLNSHMSEVNDPLNMNTLISATIEDIKLFVNYLEVQWESPGRKEFLDKYKKQIELLQYLYLSSDFSSVVESINRIIEKMTRESRREGGLREETDHDINFKNAFTLLANKETHKTARNVLASESETLRNPCATIMLAFMYKCKWAQGQSEKEVMAIAARIDDPGRWYEQAESLKSSKREKAAAYYIGHAMLKGDLRGYKMAGFLGVRLVNYEITKECFKLAGKSDPEARKYYEAFSAMGGEEVFRKYAEQLNKKG